MLVNKKQRKSNVINNINYLIHSREETKSTISSRTGITRSTLYNILDGKVQAVNPRTIEKIADFFGTTCYVIENEDIEHIEIKERTIAIDGNKNPSAIPIINENELSTTIHKSIGELIIKYPTTYLFKDESNVFALRVNHQLSDFFDFNVLLIVKRFATPKNNELKLLLKDNNKLTVRKSNDHIHDSEKLIGIIIGERVS